MVWREVRTGQWAPPAGGCTRTHGTGRSSGHRAPGWRVRNVKFNTGIGEKEVVNFAEVRPLGILNLTLVMGS